MTNYTRKLNAKRCVLAAVLSSTFAAVLLLSMHQQVEAASARLNGHHVTKQHNKYFLNEFCDLKSKTLRSPKKYKPATDTHSLYLTSKNTLSSLRVVPQKQIVPSTISFGFGSSQQQQQQQQQQSTNTGNSQFNNATVNDQFKQLNCSIIVVGPKSHGLLVTVNSIGLPKNLTKLGIILNHDSPHAQHIHLEGETKSAHYLLTEQNSSSIAINLQTFQPIDWSRVSFDILFTVYKKSNSSTGCPNKNWFDCGDNICVPTSSLCSVDNNFTCPNQSTKLTFYHCYSPLFWSIAASTALAVLIVVVIVIVLLVVKKRRISRLGHQLSLSDNALTSEGDLMAHDNNSSKLDLTQAELANHHLHQQLHQQQAAGARTNNSYLASNLYLSGFENPVWQNNGTLTKQSTATNKK